MRTITSTRNVPSPLVSTSTDVSVQAEQIRNYFDLNMIPVHYASHELDQDYAHELFADLKKQGIDDAVCFNALHPAAADHNIQPYHILSTSESIFIALRHAVKTAVERETPDEDTMTRIVQNSSEGLILLDNHNRVIDLNKNARYIINSSEHEIRGTDILSHDVIASACADKGGIKAIDNSVINDYRVYTFPFFYNSRSVGTIVRFTHNKMKKTFMFDNSRGVKPAHKARHSFDKIIHCSSIMKNTIAIAKSFAEIESSVLILGATGTGKEIFAQSIHNLSRREHGPFVAVNCAAIPDSLFESEFFGYTPGAFTGASRNGHAGFFEQAQGGTIFLDEISEISIQMQSKLLRVIQEHQIVKVGGTRPVNLDVRFIYGVNRNLRSLISKGKFREDLYFRISAVRLPLPPLKERGNDVQLLFDHYLDLFSERFGKNRPAVAENVKDILNIHTWPGNVRELMNLCKHLAATSQGTAAISSEDILKVFSMEQEPRNDESSDGNTVPDTPADYSSLKEIEKQSIVNALIKSGNKKNQAALLLGINRSTLWRKIREYNL